MNILNPANLITLIRLILGFFLSYIVYISDKTTSIFLYLVFLILDFFDGFTARKLKCETTFGKNFDFIVDGLIGFSVATILLIQGIIPIPYLVLMTVPLTMLAISVLWGIKLKKKTFIPSKWRKTNGLVFYVILLLFLINYKPTIIIAYFLLIYVYISRIKHLIELKQLRKS